MTQINFALHPAGVFYPFSAERCVLLVMRTRDSPLLMQVQLKLHINIHR